MKKIIATAAVAFAAAAATADVSGLQSGPIIAPYEASISVDFVSSSAGWTGYLGWLSNVENEGVMQLMSNKSDRNAAPTTVGTVAAGEAALFQYEVTRGVRNTFRQDDEAGANQFRHQWISDSTARLFVEDIKLPGGDADYNDAIFDITFNPVPTPGTMVMAGLAGGLLVKRRR